MLIGCDINYNLVTVKSSKLVLLLISNLEDNSQTIVCKTRIAVYNMTAFISKEMCYHLHLCLLELLIQVIGLLFAGHENLSK